MKTNKNEEIANDDSDIESKNKMYNENNNHNNSLNISLGVKTPSTTV